MLITDRVSGDEEVPANVTAVLTRDTPDLVSHLAVRARNARVPLATCWDEAVYQSFKELAGKQVGIASQSRRRCDFRGKQQRNSRQRKSRQKRPAGPFQTSAQP